MDGEKRNLLYLSNKPILIFLFITSLPWWILSLSLFIHGSYSSGLKLLFFGSAYMVVLIAAQTYFRKMLILYQKNLDKSINNKLRRISK